MVNSFPARERTFIGTLAEDLHLSVTWDEYDNEDRNLVVWRFPGASLEEPIPDSTTPANGAKSAGEIVDAEPEGDEGDEEWEDVEEGPDDEEEDEESKAAVDRVLKKYEKADVFDDEEGGGFDARYERSMKEKMDEWKRGYYKVRFTHAFR